MSENIKIPRSAEVIKQLLNEMGVKNYEPQIVMQLTDLAHSLTKHILTEANSLAEFSGKPQVDQSDIQFAIKACQEKFQPNRPSKMFLIELAAQKNQQPLLPIRQNYGLRLPNDRFCQVQPNFSFDEQGLRHPSSSYTSQESSSQNSMKRRYNTNLSDMNTESVMMSLDSQDKNKRRKLDQHQYNNDREEYSIKGEDYNKDDYYD